MTQQTFGDLLQHTSTTMAGTSRRDAADARYSRATEVHP
jgi:hypothetical protein